MNVDLLAGTASGDGSDTFATVENVIGSPGSDVLTGDGQANVLQAAGGDDTLAGGGGNDDSAGRSGRRHGGLLQCGERFAARGIGDR